jgi:DNA-binding helix-hairpin-helix protein with protein kinase domain
LARNFDILCGELLAQEWAHGDLKPENIVVASDGGMTPVDCDAMWIPAFAGRRACELGTPPYRHPERDESWFDKRIDDYSIKFISAALHALALDPTHDTLGYMM